MRMQKRIIAIMFATTMAFVLMACGADNKKVAATEEMVTEIESQHQEVVEPTESVQETEGTEVPEEVEESTVAVKNHTRYIFLQEIIRASGNWCFFSVLRSLQNVLFIVWGQS